MVDDTEGGPRPPGPSRPEPRRHPLSPPREPMGRISQGGYRPRQLPNRAEDETEPAPAPRRPPPPYPDRRDADRRDADQRGDDPREEDPGEDDAWDDEPREDDGREEDGREDDYRRDDPRREGRRREGRRAPPRREVPRPPPRARRAGLLRPVGFDDLGLRRALSDRLLPFLVAAMAFLAALAFAGAMATASLANHWQHGAEAELTIQVPQPQAPATGTAGERLTAVLGLLHADPAILSARVMTQAELSHLLEPWLGAGSESLGLTLPAVIAVQLQPGQGMPPGLAGRLRAAAPDTLAESADVWAARLSALARSLQACAAVALLLVIAVAIAVVMVATRAGLAARRESIEIVHGLGATDGYIAGRFARRAMRLTAAGGVGGAVVALPVLIWLAALAAPFSTAQAAAGGASAVLVLPIVLWAALPALPVAAALIGYVTAEITVRRWLRQLP